MIKINQLIFDKGSSFDGRLQKSFRKHWHLSRNSGRYETHEDFFSIHYEIKENKPNEVQIHVEAPKESIDRDLNSIKAKIVKELIHSKMLFLKGGWKVKIGTRITEKSLKNNKLTTALVLILPKDKQYLSGKYEETMKQLDLLLGESVRKVIFVSK